MSKAARASQGGVVLVIAALIGALCASWAPSWSALLVVATGLVLALPVLWRAITGELDIFEPLVIFSLAFGAMFVARPAAMLSEQVHFYVLVGVPGDITATFRDMQVLGLAGAAAFGVGYMSSFGPRLAKRTRGPVRADPAALGNWGLLVFLVGASATVLFAQATGGFSALFAGRSSAYYQSLEQ